MKTAEEAPRSVHPHRAAKGMRVMVISPIFGGSYPIAQHSHEALTRLGCSSDFVDLTHHRERYQEVRDKGEGALTAQQNFYNHIQEELLQRCDSFQPNLILALILAPLPESFLAQMRSSGVTTAYWFVDNDKRFPFWKRQAKWYDFYFMIQNDHVISRVKKAGGRSVHYLPNACPENIAKNLSVPEHQRAHFGSDVCFMGTPCPNRVTQFSQLQDLNLGLWGKGWDQYATQFPTSIREGSRLITAGEEARIYASSKIVLNLHTDLGSEEHDAADFINPRTFVAAGCGTLQLVDKRSLMSEHFHIGDEVIEFDSTADLKNKLIYFLNHPEERLAIAAKARKRVLKEHTYEDRMNQVLAWVTTKD